MLLQRKKMFIFVILNLKTKFTSSKTTILFCWFTFLFLSFFPPCLLPPLIWPVVLMFFPQMTNVYLELSLEEWYVSQWTKLASVVYSKNFYSWSAINMTFFLTVLSYTMDLRFNLDLCPKEKLYRQHRRDRVMLGIKKLLHMEKPSSLPSSPHEVPPINQLLL